MKQRLKRVGLGLLLVLLLLLALVWTMQRWLVSQDFKARLERELGGQLGVAVTLRELDLDVWPLPAVAATGIRVLTRPALALERLELRPAWSALLAGRFEIATLLVHEAQLPQAGMEALLEALQKKRSPKATSEPTTAPDAYLPQHSVLKGVSWVHTTGNKLLFDADVLLDEKRLPREVTVKLLKGPMQGAQARLQQLGNDWLLAMDLGGGSVKGRFQLQASSAVGGAFSVKGQLQTRGVDVAALSGVERPVLTGRLDADTTLSLRALSLGAMLDALQTQSHFNVRNAVVHGIDLARAVKTVGMSRGGNTPLDTLAGRLVSHGRALQFTSLVASSGVLSANGHVAVTAKQALSGRVSVDLAASALGGAVSVPLLVGGTLAEPELTLTRAALVGAAIGTAVLPGVGTGAGASLGDKIDSGVRKLFGK